MADIVLRTEGAAGRITLNRPDKLNALTHGMCLAIEAALDGWSRDDGIALVLIDAAGEKAFSAGGDLRFIHDAAVAGDYAVPREFWRDEYRLNLKIAEYPKPVVSLMQGYAMGGGVGIGCHASHRVVCETSRLAMPECSIGLVPDVGGTWLLSQAPGHVGEFLALTAGRMGPGDAVFAGFADHYLPRDRWPELTAKLARGTVSAVADMAEPAPAASLEGDRGWIDSAFSLGGTGPILEALGEMDFAAPQRGRCRRQDGNGCPACSALPSVSSQANGAPAARLSNGFPAAPVHAGFRGACRAETAAALPGAVRRAEATGNAAQAPAPSVPPE
ncbi:enoyl-CoA hydratase/isomerase family protein [Mangrovicoccus ximenensis]|uniref:enoyl-CoA hydratase/isomerase family protein n=1 Tax=Mangrovicoccus ximenensis TaxID=1911570 RepID=UPI000D335593|nr:enoyl-CoA hydratase/isomerase family protein [Mangrovicoccus ximenensis]